MYDSIICGFSAISEPIAEGCRGFTYLGLRARGYESSLKPSEQL